MNSTPIILFIQIKMDKYVDQFKNIQSNFLSYIDENNNCEENYENLVSSLENMKIRENKDDLELFLKLVIQISNDHYRTLDFFNKICKVLSLFKEEIKHNYTNIEIFSLFKSNKRLLLFLLEEKLMVIDKEIYNIMLDHKYTNLNYGLYFSPETRPFLMEEVTDDNYQFDDMQSMHGFLLFMKPFLKESMKKNPKPNIPADFYEKRKIGENEDKICELIRKDSLQQFKAYMKKKRIPADYEFEPSIYETNSQLMKGGVTNLIEYAAFFGSIQIFKYLASKGVELYPALWNYAVHGNNAKILEFLEEKKLKFHYESMFVKNSDYDSCEPESSKEKNDSESNEEEEEEEEEDITEYDSENEGVFRASRIFNFDGQTDSEDEISDFKNSPEKVLKEAIKCHHNELANYIAKKYLNDTKIEYHNQSRFNKSVNAYAFKFYNFAFIPKEFTQKFIFFYACQYGYYKIVAELLDKQKGKLTINVVFLSNFNDVSKLFFFLEFRKNFFIKFQ